jgi:hypothetical protein
VPIPGAGLEAASAGADAAAADGAAEAEAAATGADADAAGADAGSCAVAATCTSHRAQASGAVHRVARFIGSSGEEPGTRTSAAGRFARFDVS